MRMYCHSSSGCPFYEIWKEQTKSKKRNVIITEGEGENLHYNCLPLKYLNLFETTVPISDKLKERLSKLETSTSICPHLTLLNLLIKIENELEKALVNMKQQQNVR